MNIAPITGNHYYSSKNSQPSFQKLFISKAAENLFNPLERAYIARMQKICANNSWVDMDLFAAEGKLKCKITNRKYPNTQYYQGIIPTEHSGNKVNFSAMKIGGNVQYGQLIFPDENRAAHMVQKCNLKREELLNNKIPNAQNMLFLQLWVRQMQAMEEAARYMYREPIRVK